MTTFITLLVVVVVGFILYRSSRTTGIVYQDEGKQSKIFINKKYGIAAKPDTILNTIDGYVCVEYKSRRRGIYEGDIAEAKAAALAVRSKYPIVAIQIKNQTETNVIQLPESDDELYEQIRRYKEMAEAAKTQLLPAKPNQFKCRHCAVRASCRDRAA